MAVLLLLAILSTGCADAIGGSPGPAPPGAFPVVVDPVVPGWNVVRSVQRGAVYDAPPAWTVKSEGTVIGYRDRAGNPVVSSGAATVGEGVCGEHSNLAIAVVRHDEGTDLDDAARRDAEVWAAAAYGDESGEPALSTSAPETITTGSGQVASVVKVTAALAAPSGACRITTGSAYAVAAKGYAGELGPTVVLVVVADVGVPGAAQEAEIRRMPTTLRPVV